MDWGRVKEVFGAVLDADERTRADVLERACAGDSTLRTQVESLLSAHDGGGVFDEPRGPERVGPFELGRELGRGAFGVVRLGVQRHPVSREVAVKLLHAGSDARGVLARFRSEQETLAHLDHPGIARLIECGSDERGRPWFAMELARGERITRACDERKLGVRERVELMVQVCRAVQHAHQRGVIHRDLKPSNIIVGEDENGALRAKVIDFGIAKALSTGAGAMNPMMTLTREHQLIGTPAYMSPEQAAGGAVETTSDVYALGAVLFELLTGRPPVDAGELSRAAPGELAQVIRASAPGRVSSLAQPHDARERRLLRELDWVVLGALRADPRQRIASAGELGDELSAALEGRPTRSGPPGARVRLREMVRRHPLGAALVAGAALLLIGVTAGSVAGLVRAREQERIAQLQAKRAESARAFVIDDALGSLASGVERGRDPSVPEMLDAASANLDERFKDDPRLKIEVTKQLCRGYLRVFKYERVLELTKSGCELALSLSTPDYLSAVDFATTHGDVSGRLGRHSEQIEWMSKAARLAREHLDPTSPEALSAEAGDALISSIRGDAEGGRRRLEEVVRLAEGRPETSHALKSALAYLLIQSEIALDPEGAMRWAEKRLEACERGDRNPTEILDSAGLLIRHQILLGRLTEARALLDRMVREYGAARGTPGMARILSQGSRLELIEGHKEAAHAMAKKSYVMATGEAGLTDDQIVATLEAMAEGETAMGNLQAGVSWMTRARDAVEGNMGASAREARWSNLNLARTCWAAGDLAGCEAAIARATRGVPRERGTELRRALMEACEIFTVPRTGNERSRAKIDALLDMLDGDWGEDRNAQLAVAAFVGDGCKSMGESERASKARAIMVRVVRNK